VRAFCLNFVPVGEQAKKLAPSPNDNAAEMTTIVERDAVRAILLTPQNEVLLMRIRPPNAGESFWITPGGGLESGETTEQCLRRELREELGLVQFELGPLVWRRQHTFNWAHRRICQRESYHVVRVEKFEPCMTDEVESKVLERFQWWRAHDLSLAGEPLTPLSLADIVAGYLSNGAPTAPLETEVLVD
jgi:8-oxo-dGTP pyrophosphatase MutT (NUDIX family)